MRTLLFLFGLTCVVTLAVADGPYQIAQKSEHQRLWQTVVSYTNEAGREITRTNGYTELGIGLYRMTNGVLVESSPVLEIIDNVAVGRQTRHTVLFSPDCNDWEGAVDLETPDGQRLRSRVLGISYFDPATEQSVLIAELTNSVGQLVASNVVNYPNCFTDPEVLTADLEYINNIGGIEQNLRVTSRIAAPSEWELSDETSVLQLITEFFEAPEPVTHSSFRPNGLRVDTVIRFGEMLMPPGKSFLVDDVEHSVPVDKQWTQIEGRTFLIEQIPYSRVAALLANLPLPPQTSATKGEKIRRIASTGKNSNLRHVVSRKRLLPRKEEAKAGEKKTFQVAKGHSRPAAFVLDYSVVGSVSNYVFKSDGTYFITNAVSLTGTSTTFEGGAVIKLHGATAVLTIVDGARWLSSQYNPVTITARDDQTIGESITGSGGTPSIMFGTTMLSYPGTPGSNIVQHLRLRYADTAFAADSSIVDLQNVQILKSSIGMGLSGGAVYLRNALLYDLGTGFVGSSANCRVEHLTLHKVDTFTSDPFEDSTLVLTNSLLIGITNGARFGTTTSNSTEWALSETGIFLTAGAASHYLATNSPYRDVGNTNIASVLRSNLTRMTTYPPVVMEGTGEINYDLALYPTVPRDCDTPDLGYHYDPLDWAISKLYVTNATLTVYPGTALGVFVTNAGYYGIAATPQSTIICEGTPTNRNIVCRYNSVQEQSNNQWTNRVDSLVYAAASTPTRPEVTFRFTDFSCPARDISHFYAINGESLTTLKDCQMTGGKLDHAGAVILITNCLFQRTLVALDDLFGSTVNFANNLMYGGDLNLTGFDDTGWNFRNNHFEFTTISPGRSTTNSHNAYQTNYVGWAELTPIGSGNVYPTNTFLFLSGTFGRFYQPTNSVLLNVGNTNAHLLGLYHFTTQTNNVKETNSVVDIGYHYVAANGSGGPIDGDSDGVPDYAEDSNGDGDIDSGETNPADATDPGLSVRITRPASGSNIP
jgi:hypothetical protein